VVGNGWKWLEMVGSVVGSGWKWLEMVGSGWKWLEVVGSGWKWLEVVGNGVTQGCPLSLLVFIHLHQIACQTNSRVSGKGCRKIDQGIEV